MSHALISRSADLKRLRDEGYAIEILSGHLVVHDIPYVNARRELAQGKFVCPLNLQGDRTGPPPDHVMWFVGEHPCDRDGNIITAIQHSAHSARLSDEVVTSFSFSNKPQGGYPNYYEKVVTYTRIITAPARSIVPGATAQTFRVMVDGEENSVFNYIETNSSRAGITELTARFDGLRIGIIGVGGTGSYILDQVAKTPVAEIRLFDDDDFLQHNAFRSPGAATKAELEARPKKVDHQYAAYSKMHRGIKPHAVRITEDNLGLLDGLDYVFICIDSNSAKAVILSHLIEPGIPFIDCGLGVNVSHGELIGQVRVTVGTPSFHEHLANRIGKADSDDDEYATNIQIADLNMLNASLAVIKWKQLCSFYQDQKQAHHVEYVISTGQITREEVPAPVL
ncbi:MAG: ThiF family adenylyltransferase [Flavobacteriales bacterium]|nr:ThiF family adenylyltransferase [Flavobacteriales bacterium]